MATSLAKKTWVVLVRGQNAAVFEHGPVGAELTRVHEFEMEPTAAEALRTLATWLDAARRGREFDRLMLIAPRNDGDRLISDLSRPTRALIEPPQPEIVRSLAEEATR